MNYRFSFIRCCKISDNTGSYQVCKIFLELTVFCIVLCGIERS